MSTNYDETMLFARLLFGEPDATSDLAEAFLEKLCLTLASQFSGLPPSLCVDDFAVDSILRLGKNPHCYKPKRGMSLFSYLVQDARGDILNALARERRQSNALRISVEQMFNSRNILRSNETEDAALAHLAGKDEPLPVSPSDLDSFLLRAAQATKEPYDVELLRLLWQEERKTEPYAEAMGISELAPEEQRMRVKKAKDRLKVALKRLGVMV